MKIKKMIMAFGLALIMLSIPCVVNASARYGTSPGSGWVRSSSYYGNWFTKNSGGIVGSNYYSTSFDYSKASVEDGLGNTSSSGWRLQDEAYAARSRTIRGTNKAYYNYSD